MNTQTEAFEASGSPFKPPVAMPRDTADPPIPGIRCVEAKSREKSGRATLAGTEPMSEARRARIALVAYHLAEERGFDPGHEVEDWLAAEARTAAESL